MKKILSLTLAALMVVSMVPTAFAADYTAGTKVEYVAADQTAYTITVPALLNPGQSGDVTLSGTWASDHTVKVTADKTVELVNSINNSDKKVLNISFAGIEKAGDNTQSRTYTEAVSVAEMPSDALFGTWSGKFNYNVELDDGVALQTFTIDGTEYQAKEGMTWAEWIESEYNTIGAWLPDIGAPVSVTIDGQNYTVTYAKPEGGSSSFNDYHEVLKYTEYSLTARSY